jgi:hypothetical protein
MDKKLQRPRSTAEITAATTRFAALCQWKPNAPVLELLTAGLMAVGWSPADALL